MRDHRLLDARSLAFAQAIAERLRQNPALVDMAKGNISRWLRTSSPGVTLTLAQWWKILERPVDEIIAVLTSPDEDAVRLRQSNPFAAVLTNKERNAILVEFEARDKAAT